ncbi:hypothetical protein Avbf_11257 [Armadillidium vulgare]|nr:hypothetical protein Avbf_11257 [Armadillidium vulgare]
MEGRKTRMDPNIVRKMRSQKKSNDYMWILYSREYREILEFTNVDIKVLEISHHVNVQAT